MSKCIFLESKSSTSANVLHKHNDVALNPVKIPLKKLNLKARVPYIDKFGI